MDKVLVSKIVDHKVADDGEFIEQVIDQTASMKVRFAELGHDPYDLPDNFVIQIYPAVFIRLVDLMAKAHDEGFSRKPS